MKGYRMREIDDEVVRQRLIQYFERDLGFDKAWELTTGLMTYMKPWARIVEKSVEPSWTALEQLEELLEQLEELKASHQRLADILGFKL